MLDSSVESVKSALKRAHASLQRRQPATGDREPPPASGSPAEDAIVAKFVRAWESADLDALVALLTDDVFMSMPPMPFEYEGRDAVARFCASLFGAGHRFDLVPARANGQPAFGAYLRGTARIVIGQRCSCREVGVTQMSQARARVGRRQSSAQPGGRNAEVGDGPGQVITVDLQHASHDERVGLRHRHFVP